MSEVIIVRAEQTCWACPSQWDAWDLDGNYWYLRYRFSRGTATRYPSPDPDGWTHDQPNITFDTDRGQYDGEIELDEFCELAGLNLVLQ